MASRLNGNHGPGELARRTPTRIDGTVRAPYASCPDPADRRDDQHCDSGPIESPPDLNIWGAQLRWPGELPPLMHKSLISWFRVSSVSGNGSARGTAAGQFPCPAEPELAAHRPEHVALTR